MCVLCCSFQSFIYQKKEQMMTTCLHGLLKKQISVFIFLSSFETQAQCLFEKWFW